MSNAYIIAIPAGSPLNTFSAPFRIAKKDISSVMQIHSGATGDKAELWRSFDGGTYFEPYDIETVRREIEIGNTNVIAIDAIGIYKVKLTATAGAAGVNVDLASFF